MNPKSAAVKSAAAAALLLGLALPERASSLCARSDVDYYLSQGFTRAQVVSICTGEMPKPKQPEASERSEPLPRESFEKHAPSRRAGAADHRPRDSLEDFLMFAIDGYDVRVSPEALYYTRRTCIEYGPFNEYGIKTQTCPDVRFRIARKGLQVRRVKQALMFLGNYEVTLSGEVEREILTLDRYPSSVKARLSAYLESGNEITIPIRDGIPRERLQAALRELVP